jgi:galactokinase
MELGNTVFGAHTGAPSGVWSAPGRVNLIGEHTDYNQGLCLPIALPHRTYVALRPSTNEDIQLASRQGTQLWCTTWADLRPGNVSGWGTYAAGVAWALREAGHQVGGFDATVDSAVPLGASLSSSAALECAFAVALDSAFNLGLAETPEGRRELVAACRRAENDMAGAPTGGLDQMASMFCQAGHALALDFREGIPDAEAARLVPFDLAAAGLTILVVDSRAPHALVDGQYAERRNACQSAAESLGIASLREINPASLDATLESLTDPVQVKRVRHVVTEIQRTAEFIDVVQAGLVTNGAADQDRITHAGALMNASHDSLRDDYQVTVPQTDLAVDASRAAGAIGARMTGGGFGGATIALVRQEDVERVAATVAQEFASAGYTAPAFLESPPSGSAGRDLVVNDRAMRRVTP